MLNLREVAHDWVQINNGPNPSAPILDVYCSSNKPQLKTRFHTSGNTALVIFQADNSNGGSGFTLNWNAFTGKCGNQAMDSKLKKCAQYSIFRHKFFFYHKF